MAKIRRQEMQLKYSFHPVEGVLHVRRTDWPNDIYVTLSPEQFVLLQDATRTIDHLLGGGPHVQLIISDGEE